MPWIIGFLFVSQTSWAQRVHPVDRALSECIDRMALALIEIPAGTVGLRLSSQIDGVVELMSTVLVDRNCAEEIRAARAVRPDAELTVKALICDAVDSAVGQFVEKSTRETLMRASTKCPREAI